MHKDLENKVAIITGASRGLGQEYAVKLAEAGAKVLVVDINKKFAQKWIKDNAYIDKIIREDE